MHKTIPLTAALTAGLCGACLSGASADTAVPFTFLGASAASSSVSISTDGGSSFNSVAAGRYLGLLGSDNINIYCVDVRDNVLTGANFPVNASHLITEAATTNTTTVDGNTYYAGGLASALTPSDYTPSGGATLPYSARAGQVAWLADNFLNLNTFGGESGATDAATNQTAVNLAIWDIVQDGGDGTEAGSTRLGAQSPVDLSKYVSYYEVEAAKHGDYTSSTAYFVQAPLNIPGPNGTAHYQDFVYSTALPTPEAGTLAAMGLLVIGAAALRRRRASYASISAIA